MPSRLTWQRHVDAWRASGLSAPAFAALHHLDPRSLYSWSSRLQRSASASSPVSFLQVLASPSSSSSSTSAPIEILLSRQRRLLVRPGFDPALLRLVVETLEES